MYVDEWERDGLTGNEIWEGMCIDLVQKISEIWGFKYIIKLVEDKAHGRKNDKGEWNGLIKELIDGVSRRSY